MKEISVVNEINKKLDKINIKLKTRDKFSKRVSKRVSKSMKIGSFERRNKTRKSIFSRRIKSYS